MAQADIPEGIKVERVAVFPAWAKKNKARSFQWLYERVSLLTKDGDSLMITAPNKTVASGIYSAITRLNNHEKAENPPATAKQYECIRSLKPGSTDYCVFIRLSNGGGK